MLRCLCLHRTRILVGDVGRLRLKATRAPTPAATTTAAPSTSPLAALAVLGARSTISSTTTATPTTAAATFLALRTGSRRRGGRSLRRHHVPARPEVGIYFDDADLRDLGNPACAGTAGATARAAPETRAAHRNTAGCRRRRAVGRRRRGRRRHRNVVLFLYIGRRSGRDRTRSLRLFLGRRLLVRTDTADGLLDQSERVAEKPGFRSRGRRRCVWLLRLHGLVGVLRRLSSGRQLFPVASAASSSTPAPPSAATWFLAGFAHRRECGLGRRALDLGAEGDLVLAVVESGQRDEAAAGGFDHEFAEPRE